MDHDCIPNHEEAPIVASRAAPTAVGVHQDSCRHRGRPQNADAYAWFLWAVDLGWKGHPCACRNASVFRLAPRRKHSSQHTNSRRASRCRAAWEHRRPARTERRGRHGHGLQRPRARPVPNRRQNWRFVTGPCSASPQQGSQRMNASQHHQAGNPAAVKAMSVSCLPVSPSTTPLPSIRQTAFAVTAKACRQ